MLVAQQAGLPALTSTSIRQMEYGETCRVKILDALGALQQHGAVEDGLLLTVTLESEEEQQLFRDIPGLDADSDLCRVVGRPVGPV